MVKVDGDNKMPMRRSRASKQINPEPITFNDAATVLVVDSNCADLIYYEGKNLHSCAKHEILNFCLHVGIINVSARAVIRMRMCCDNLLSNVFCNNFFRLKSFGTSICLILVCHFFDVLFSAFGPDSNNKRSHLRSLTLFWFWRLVCATLRVSEQNKSGSRRKIYQVLSIKISSIKNCEFLHVLYRNMCVTHYSANWAFFKDSI